MEVLFFRNFTRLCYATCMLYNAMKHSATQYFYSRDIKRLRVLLTPSSPSPKKGCRSMIDYSSIPSPVLWQVVSP